MISAQKYYGNLITYLTMEVGDLDRSGNSVDAKFNATEGDLGTGTNNKFVGTGNNETALSGQIISFAAESSEKAWDLDAVSMGVFQQALENISFLRAQVGGGMSRLSFAADSLSVQQTNIRAALGRIEDVDIAEESANLSKYSILTQAAAAMVSQANSTNDVALMLLR